MEHGPHRPDDLLPRGRRQHPGTPRFTGQVREQDPDAHQDRPQLQDAQSFPARRLLHAERTRRSRDVVHGPRAHPAIRPALVQTDGRRHHPFPIWHQPRRGPVDSQPVPLHPAVGVGVHRFAEGVGGVRVEEAGGERAEQEVDVGGSGGFVGQGHPEDQHAVPEGPAHAGVRQGVEDPDGVQAVPGESFENGKLHFFLREFDTGRFLNVFVFTQGSTRRNTLK